MISGIALSIDVRVYLNTWISEKALIGQSSSTKIFDIRTEVSEFWEESLKNGTIQSKLACDSKNHSKQGK